MKRLFCVLACLLSLATGAMAQDDVPGLRQSINYFEGFSKETTALLAQVRDSLAREQQAQDAPRTDACLFLAELAERLERLQLLTANVDDLYVLYNKTTYCYAKDEKNYLYGRFDSIQTELQRLADAPFRVNVAAGDADLARLREKQSVFAERIARLRAFMTSSLPAFRR